MQVQVGYRRQRGGNGGNREFQFVITKIGEFNVHTVGLYLLTTQTEYKVLFLQFECGLTLPMGKAQDTKVSMAIGKKKS